MKEFIIKDSDFDAKGLDYLLENLDNNASFLPTVTQPRFSTVRRCNPYLKCLIAAGITFCNLGELIADNKVRFDDSKSQEISLDEYKENVESPYISYISELSEFVFKNKTSKMDIIKKIVSFESLKQNWDGYEAIPLEVNSAANSINLINLLDESVVESIDDIYPNTHGTVSFEWSNSSKERLSLEVGNETFSYYLKLNSQAPQFFNDIEITSTEIYKLSKHIISL